MSKPTPEQTAARADLLVTFDAHECHPAPAAAPPAAEKPAEAQ